GTLHEVSVNRGDTGDERIGLYRAKRFSGVRIDLMDLPLAIVSDPERAFGPREARVGSAAGCRNRREHATGFGVDLLDAILGNLKQVLAVESRPRVRGDVNRAMHRAAGWVDGVERLTG